MLKHKFSLLITVFILAISCSAPSNEAEELFEEIINSEIEKELIVLMNEYRRSKGLGKLSVNYVAQKYASQHNTYMISINKISHDNFQERASQLSAETNAVLVAENLAKDYDNANDAFEAWLNSPGHKDNIEADFTHTGISAKKDALGNYYYTQIFFR